LPAATGDLVRVHYRATLTDGTEFDSTKERGPVEFRLGDGNVIDGFEAAIIGMEVGESRTVTVPPSQAYGPDNPDLVQRISAGLFEFPTGLGMRVGLVAEDDETRMEGVITGLEQDETIVDLNHPLAGMTLVYEIRLEEIM